MDISDDSSICRDVNSSDEEEINDQRIGEDDGILDNIIIIILNDIILFSA